MPCTMLVLLHQSAFRHLAMSPAQQGRSELVRLCALSGKLTLCAPWLETGACGCPLPGLPSMPLEGHVPSAPAPVSVWQADLGVACRALPSATDCHLARLCVATPVDCCLQGGALCPNLPFGLCPRIWDEEHVPEHEIDDVSMYGEGVAQREHWPLWMLVAAVLAGLLALTSGSRASSGGLKLVSRVQEAGGDSMQRHQEH